MRPKPGPLKRFMSLNQHRKRLGARKYSHETQSLDVLKHTIIDAGEPSATRGSTKSLDTHIQNLRREFSGQSMLLCHHAELIVLIRREYKIQETYQRFQRLWRDEEEFLLSNLNVRWLVSAADTFARQDADMTVRSVGMMTALLANTVKMYESEKYLSATEDVTLDEDRVAHVAQEYVPLFEGMSCFTVGTDDTLRNMVWGMEQFSKISPVGPIFFEVWSRFQENDTVFSRFKKHHHRESTRWWKDP